MATENKEELLKKIVILEAENSKLISLKSELDNLKKELADSKRVKEELIANENTIRKELQKIQEQLNASQKGLEIKVKEVDSLKSELTKLANLFDEYIAAYQDQVKMLGVFVKNTQTVEKYLSGKIEDFNGGNKK